VLEKNVLGSWKVLELFLSKRVGTLIYFTLCSDRVMSLVS